jgi:acyl-coenzyme A thioesterase PaaI-like protein
MDISHQRNNILKPRFIRGSRFVSGDRPAGFGTQLFLHDDGKVSCTLSIDEGKQGPPEHVHGGALASLLDEVMGAAAWYAGYRVLAVNLNIDYKKAVPLNASLVIEGTITRKEGRKIYAQGKIILEDGTVAVEGSGIFVDAPHVVGEDHKNPFDWE